MNVHAILVQCSTLDNKFISSSFAMCRRFNKINFIFTIIEIKVMNPILAFAKLIRLPNLLLIALTQYAIRFCIVAPILMKTGVELQLAELDFFLVCLSTVMIGAAGYIINDYFDLRIDRVNRPERIIVGKFIKRRVVMGAHIVINSLAILIALYLAYIMKDFKLVLIQLLTAGALWYYSLSFKKQVLTGNVVIAILAALVPFLAGFYEMKLQNMNAEETVNSLMFTMEVGTAYDDVFSSVMSNFYRIWMLILAFSFFAFLSTMIREIIKDIEDYEGDKKYMSNTLPVMYGIKRAKWVAYGFIVILVAAVAYVQSQLFLAYNDMISLLYLLFAVQMPTLYVFYKLTQAKEKKDFSTLSMNVKLVMLGGVGYCLLLYYIFSITV